MRFEVDLKQLEKINELWKNRNSLSYAKNYEEV